MNLHDARATLDSAFKLLAHPRPDPDLLRMALEAVAEISDQLLRLRVAAPLPNTFPSMAALPYGIALRYESSNLPWWVMVLPKIMGARILRRRVERRYANFIRADQTQRELLNYRLQQQIDKHETLPS